MARGRRRRKISPQQRYQNALRVIKVRGKVSHKVAQQAYRQRRDVVGPSIPASQFRELSDSTFRRLIRKTVKAVEVTLFDSEQAAFDLVNLPEFQDRINRGLAQLPKSFTLNITYNRYVVGMFDKTHAISRIGIDKAEFWTVYHDMTREVLNRADSEDAITVVKITAV